MNEARGLPLFGPRITDSTVLPYTTPRTCTQPGCDCRRHPAPLVPLDDEDGAA